VEVQPEIAPREEPLPELVGHLGGGVPSRATRERPVQVLVVDGDVALLSAVGRDVRDVDDDERPRELRGIVAGGDLLGDLHAVEFVAVDRRREEHARAGVLAVRHREGHLDRRAVVRLTDLVVEVARLARWDRPVAVLERAFGRPTGVRVVGHDHDPERGDLYVRPGTSGEREGREEREGGESGRIGEGTVRLIALGAKPLAPR
jgi:hypothetical protein